jgi:hypothetical protein
MYQYDDFATASNTTTIKNSMLLRGKKLPATSIHKVSATTVHHHPNSHVNLKP